MGNYGAETQQKTVSWPLSIHPPWCTGGVLVHCALFISVDTSFILQGYQLRQALCCATTSSWAVPRPSTGGLRGLLFQEHASRKCYITLFFAHREEIRYILM
jgi:hypothetical protein